MAKFKLNKPVLLQEEFAAGEVSNPGQNVTPAAKTEPASVAVDKTDAKGAEIRAEIIADVDTILTNLETLSKQITEEVLRDVDVIIAETLAQPIYENKFFEEMLKQFRSMKSYTKLKSAWPKLYKATLDQQLANLDSETSFNAEKADKIDALLVKVKEKFDKSKEKVKDMQIPGEKKRQERAKIDAAFQDQKEKIKAKITKKLDAQLEQLKAANTKKLQDIQAKLSDFEAENKIESELINKQWTTEKGNQKSDMDIQHISDKNEVILKYDESDDPAYAKRLKDKAAEETKELNQKEKERSARREEELRELQAEADERAAQGSEEEKEANKKIKDLYSAANAYVNALKSMPEEEDDVTDEIVANVKSAKKKYTAAKSEVTEDTFIKGGIASEETEAKTIKDEITKMIDDALSEYSDRAAAADTKKTQFEKAIDSAEEKSNEAKNELDLIKDDGSEDEVRAAQNKYWNAEIEVQKAKKSQAENDGDDVSSFDSKIAELQDKIDNNGAPEPVEDSVQVEDVEEGNAFGAARAEAIAKGEKTFKVGDEEYDVESVDAEDKENAEEYAEEEGIATEAVTESASFKMGSIADRFRSLM